MTPPPLPRPTVTRAKVKAVSAGHLGATRQGVRSSHATRTLYELLEIPAGPRRRVMAATISPRELRVLMNESAKEFGTAYKLWFDTPAGFVEDVLGETIWAKQREILEAMTGHKRVMVPAGYGVGKTHIAARAVLFFVATNPVGGTLAVTTATRFRQVRYQLWPHIRKAHARSGLPGHCDTVQLKMPDQNGVDTVVAYGFTAPENDEAAMQGIHSTKLLLVVDEAGGISRTIGSGTNNLLTGDARMIAIGNPATDDPRSWFETTCEEGDDPEQPGTITIPIAAVDSPLITGGPTPICRDCTPNSDGHTVAKHLPDQEWVDRTIREFGIDHPYVQAKVFAKFPQGGGRKTLPIGWLEIADENPDPEPDDDWVRICDLGLPGEDSTVTVRRGSWVRFGVDIAADGGDEVAVYRIIGDVIDGPIHVSSGAVNADQVLVAENILECIHAGQRLADALGSKDQIRAKIDQNGLGHGVTSLLRRWGPEGKKEDRPAKIEAHRSVIVGVMVSENPGHPAADIGMKPWRKRDEMWLSLRELVRPDPSTGLGRIRLRVDRKCFLQLATPNLSENSAGFTLVESNSSMRSRGFSSPDRAVAAVLAAYEPAPLNPRKRRGILN